MSQDVRCFTRSIRIAGLCSMLMSGFLWSCQPSTESGRTVPERDVNTVMEAHVDQLMEFPGVVGVAIGETDDKTPCILVLIEKQSDITTDRIPETLEGHPVRILVSGKIEPMDDD